jgi:hypothetical protein
MFTVHSAIKRDLKMSHFRISEVGHKLAKDESETLTPYVRFIAVIADRKFIS